MKTAIRLWDYPGFTMDVFSSINNRYPYFPIYNYAEKCNKKARIKLYEEDKFLSFGSGSPFSLGVLEADWTPKMTKSAGIDLIKTAISSSRERDAASGFELQICTIDKAGFKQIQ